jgi:hypothetical protein
MTQKENLRENQKYGHLMELPVLRKLETGLPVNIWVDQKESIEELEKKANLEEFSEKLKKNK